MRYDLRTRELRRLATEEDYLDGYSSAVVKAYRKMLQSIEAATDERDLRALKSHRFEKLKGKRSHQRSVRLKDQYRLILEIDTQGGQRVVHVIDIEDYH